MGFECDECGKAFQTSIGMEKHAMATHYIAITVDDLDLRKEEENLEEPTGLLKIDRVEKVTEDDLAVTDEFMAVTVDNLIPPPKQQSLRKEEEDLDKDKQDKADLEEDTSKLVVTEESWENQEDISELIKCNRRELGESNQDS